MMDYKVTVAPNAKEQMKQYLAYILFVFENEQAYESVKQDYYNTLKRLAKTAGMMRVPDEPELLERGLRRFHFEMHDYVILYRIKDGVTPPLAEVAYIFHTSEDYIKNI